MNVKLILITSFTLIFIILATISEWTLYTDAQNDSIKNNAPSGPKTTSIGNISSIITPWNTGNERNNSGASSIG
jgi:hypothetical protein